MNVCVALPFISVCKLLFAQFALEIELRLLLAVLAVLDVPRELLLCLEGRPAVRARVLQRLLLVKLLQKTLIGLTDQNKNLILTKNISNFKFNHL